MARISDDEIRRRIQTMWADNSTRLELDALKDIKDCRSLLNDFLARMVDVYDGAEGADNRMPFTGSDIDDIRRVVG